MSEEYEKLWLSMEQEAGPGRTGMLRRRLTATHDDGLFLGYDAESARRLFLVELGLGVPFSPRRIPRWKEIGIERIAEASAPDRIVVKISLANARFADVFIAFASDLYRTLAPLRQGTDVPHVLAERLEKWHQFFRAHGPEGLGREDQMGLFGELWFLCHHVIRRMRGAEAVRRWQGPEHAPHDFRFVNGAVEVKMTGGRDPRMMRVSSAQQLDDSGVPSLHVYAASLDDRGPGGITLPQMVSEVQALLGEQQSGVETFRQKLIDAGYLDIHAREYTDQYEVTEECLFRIRDGFPRITGVADGIDDVRYRIALSACRPFQVDLEQTLSGIMGADSK